MLLVYAFRTHLYHIYPKPPQIMYTPPPTFGCGLSTGIGYHPSIDVAICPRPLLLPYCKSSQGCLSLVPSSLASRLCILFVSGRLEYVLTSRQYASCAASSSTPFRGLGKSSTSLPNSESPGGSTDDLPSWAKAEGCVGRVSPSLTKDSLLSALPSLLAAERDRTGACGSGSRDEVKAPTTYPESSASEPGRP
jgi:hypothetical protein